MKAKRVVTESGEEYGFRIECPGCKAGGFGGAHILTTGKVTKTRWEFNYDLDKPTFSPSLLCQFGWGEERTKVVCHSFIRDGMIQYLADCTHPLANQTVELPDLE
jgi:hypothetical protein